MFEHDGAEDSDAQPVTSGQIYNFTAVGNPLDGDGANGYGYNGTLTMAADSYLRSYELDNGEHPEKALRAAKILAGRGSLEESKRMLNRVAERKTSLEEKDLKELLKLQARVAVADGGGETVVKILEEVVEVDALDGEALILLAQHYGRTIPEKAIFYYERAANIEKHEAEAKLYHGQLLVGQAKYVDALPLLRRACELKPRSDIEDYLKQVERIAKSRI